MRSRNPILHEPGKIEQNVVESTKLGWAPGDFGAAGFGPELIRAIEIFQEERMMRPTGVANWRTYKALLTYRSALKEASVDRQRRDNLRHLGAVDSLPEDDPRVVASAAFAGVGVMVGHDTSLSLLSRLLRSGHVEHLIVPRGHPELGLVARFASDTGRRLSVAGASSYGVKTGLSRASRRVTVTGAVVAMPDVRDWAQAVHADKARRALVELREEGLPVALLMPSWHPRWRTTPKEKEIWLSMLDLADVYMPRVPGGYRGGAPEYWMGVCLAEWSIALGRMNNAARWIFPMYQPMLGDSDHTVRFRAYLKSRSVRGHAFSELPNDAGCGPYFGPLPGHIRKIDDVAPMDRPW